MLCPSFTTLLWKHADCLFFGCHYSEKIWRNLTKKLLGLRYIHEWSRVLELVSSSAMSPTNHFLRRYVFQALIHTIWLERNGRRHGYAHHDPRTIIKFIDKQVKNRISSLHGNERNICSRRWRIGLSLEHRVELSFFGFSKQKKNSKNTRLKLH